ncbi:transcription factor zms1 [Fusarium sporotrichioides]|uniref:Transcription factor zms1 n=1 Tax=Fusarium sporotrichioides TaxID=5514 RepID=A0A395RUD9_FUSSP|nr:transcription factor zms1 [Fusarium sporotrichioides]
MTQRGIETSQSAGPSSSENSNDDIEVQDPVQATEERPEQTSVLMENNGIDNGGENGWITNEHQPIPMTSASGLMTAASLPESMFQINDLGDFAADRTTAEPAMAASSINWLSDSQYLSMWESQLSVVPDGIGPVGYAFPSVLARPNPISPWISNQYNGVNVIDMAGSAPGPAHTPSPMAAASPHHSRADSIRGSSTSKSTDGTLYVEGTMARAPFGGQLLGRHMKQVTTSHAAETGSISGAPDSLEVSNQTGSSHCVSTELYSKLVSATRGYAEIHSSDSTTTMIPPLGHIRCFVRLYYENFHNTYPFLRKSASTWKESNNWILLLAVSVIGAKYLGDTWPSSLSRLLEAILDHRLHSMPEESDQDNHGTWIPGSSQSRVRLDLTTLQAVVLSVIDRLHSGQEAVTERALSQMALLVEQCRSMNLLSQTPPKIKNDVTPSDGLSIAKWLRSQSQLRTGLMLWILDSIIAYEFDSPHLLQLHEVKTALPCQEEIWDEPTWEKINSNGCRQANGKAANAGGSEHPTILLLHLSRLYLLAPCKHLQRVATSAALPKATDGVHDTAGYTEAYAHLCRWANVDQYKARLSIVHAGALMWHIRRYSGNGFIEPHAIYLATLLVWAYSVFTSRMMDPESLQDTGMPGLRQDLVSHDSQGLANVETTPQYDDGDDEEEPEPEFIHLDRPCDDEMVQTYIRLGHKMKGYMQRVGDICSIDAPPKILKEGIRLLSHRRDKEKTWGIEISFVKGLTSLLDATTALHSERAPGSGLF